jgi:hypothetical protein
MEDLRKLCAYLREHNTWLEYQLAHPDLSAYSTTALADQRYLLRSAGDFSTFTNKATPVAADKILLEDSAASNVKKYATLSSLATAIGAAGGSTWTDMAVQPGTAHADDDEFTGTSINSAWKAMRADTFAALTPSVGVDPFSYFSTTGTGKWQQGYRSSWLAWQSPDRVNNANTADLVVWKPLSTVTTNCMFRCRWSTITENHISRDGAFSFSVCADTAGRPDFANRVQLQGATNPGAAGNTTMSLNTIVGGATTNTVTWTWIADSAQKSPLWAPMDELLIVKRGTQYLGFMGAAQRWIRLTATGGATQNFTFAPTVAHVAFNGTCDLGGSLNNPVQSVFLLDYFRRRDDTLIP